MSWDLDLIIWAADRSIKTVLDVLLSRFPLGGGSARYDSKSAGGDPIAFYGAVEFFRRYQKNAQYAMVILDFAWDHNRFTNSASMCQNLKHSLSINGWSGRCEVIVINPMLEIWAWSHIPTLARCIFEYVPKQHAPQVQRVQVQGALMNYLNNRKARLNQMLASGRPANPKQALQGLKNLYLPGIGRLHGFKLDEAFYKCLAKQIPRRVLLTCQDPSFVQLRSALSSWFGPWP